MICGHGGLPSLMPFRCWTRLRWAVLGPGVLLPNGASFQNAAATRILSAARRDNPQNFYFIVYTFHHRKFYSLSVHIRGIRNPGVRQCLGFFQLIHRPMRSKNQLYKSKHCLTDTSGPHGVLKLETSLASSTLPSPPSPRIDANLNVTHNW